MAKKTNGGDAIADNAFAQDVPERFGRVVSELSLVLQALIAIETSLSERAQSQAGIAEHIAHVRAGLEQVHTFAQETHAGLTATATPATPAE